ncbi:DUF6263 family protein [Flavobacteriaceae bacterium 3-367]|uniref:DUF6263 family protein n=1 Tax=Eudoraea algarum TaxID=3417568 RepID=UPI00326C08BD
MKFLIPTLFFVLCSTVLLGQTSLRYQLNTGDVFTIKQDAEQIITQELDGAAHEITNQISGILEFKVIGEKEETYLIELTFRDLNLRMSSSIQGLLMNVNAKEIVEGDMQSKVFNSLLNTPVQLSLAKTGDILAVQGGDSLVTKMAQASGLEDEFSLNLWKRSLSKDFGSEALSNSYKQMTFIYPVAEQKIGNSWENEYAGKLSAKNTWTLDEVTTENASISGISQIIMDVKEPATTMKLSGTQQTKIITVLASGFIKSMQVEGLAKGVSTVAQMGDQEIPTTIKSKITYELIQ